MINYIELKQACEEWLDKEGHDHFLMDERKKINELAPSLEVSEMIHQITVERRNEPKQSDESIVSTEQRNEPGEVLPPAQPEMHKEECKRGSLQGEEFSRRAEIKYEPSTRKDSDSMILRMADEKKGA